MKKIEIGNYFKQIICIIVIIMLSNFIVPNYSYAVSTGDGGSLVNLIAKFVCFVPDTVIELLQNMFVSPEKIKDSDGNYSIQYAPGTIFSGKIPAFDINFINPGSSKPKVTKKTILLGMNAFKDECVEECMLKLMDELGYSITEGETNSSVDYSNALIKIKDYLNNKDNWTSLNYLDDIQIGSDTYELYYSDNAYTARGNWHFEKKDSEDKYNPDGWVSGDYCEYNGNICNQDDVYKSIELYVKATYENTSDEYSNGKQTVQTQLEQAIEDLEYGEKKTVNIKNGEKEVTVYVERGGIQVNNLDKYHIYMIGQEEIGEYKSTAGVLQSVIATCYKALRKIALVGLLSALIYIGIKILFTSTSAKDKAKYKKMLKDWLVALCLLFTLHYLMSITITVINNVNEVVKASEIGAEGEDILMTSVRESIATGKSWSTVLPYIAIYCVLAVYTIIFTIQYLRRTIYLAFLTMIAPLITLTYPLDKIKDSKAQAFDKWLKDYIFFALLQVLHLLIYYVLLESSLNLANQGNWLYAIVAIGFMTKAEKLMKKMFGFEKSKTLGALTAGATGAIVMNAINKISHKPPKGGKAGGTSSKKTENTSVRTVTVNPINIPNIGDVNAQIGLKTNTSSQGGTGKTQSQQQTSGRGTRTEGSSSNGRTKMVDKAKEIWNKPQIKGTRYVVGKFVRNNYKQMAGKTLGVGTGIAGGMLGLASGIAEGDAGKALTRMVAGATSGSYLAQNVVNSAVDTVEKIPEKAHNIADTYREGAYGKEYANRVKASRELKNSDSYKTLQKEYGTDKEKFEKNISHMLDAEITDTKKMEKILKRNSEHPRKYNIENAILYSKMADKCSDEVLYDSSKFVRFCQKYSKDISDKDLDNLRKCIVDFK